MAERLGDSVEMIHQTYGHVTRKMRTGAVQRLARLLATPAMEKLTARDRSLTDRDDDGVGKGASS